ncbi:hypothetical protein JCM3766R1_005943 [Sporobolomyces carnicolor]
MESGPVPALDQSATTPAVTKFVQVQHDPQKAVKRTLAGFARSSGRDAVLRTIQYTLRLLLLYRLRVRPPKPSFAPSRTIRTSFALVSFLSALRRLLALEAVLRALRRLPSNANPFSALARHGHLPGAPHSPVRRNSVEYLVEFSRNLLDLVAVVTDNMYLGARLGVIPARFVDQARAKRIDRISDLATLGSVVIGFVHVETRKKQLRLRGNDKRLKAIKLEKDLEELEFWQSGQGGQGHVRSQEEVGEERRLREKVRIERSKLRRMRDELGSLRWEKCKLAAEGVFALYDALDLQVAREVAKGWSGATASAIEMSQAWAEYVRG